MMSRTGLLCTFAFTLLIVGCAGSTQTPLGVAPLPDHERTWVSPEVKGAPLLLFVADDNLGDVYIFTLPDLKLKGKITGLTYPTGECSDHRGNVYVTESSGVVEYSHSGTKVASYYDPYYSAWSCAVDPRNGDVAVIDLGKGALVYTSPSSNPIVLHNPKQDSYYFGGYNDKGELWIDGDEGQDFALSSCGASKCKTVNLKNGGFSDHAGAVQWDESGHTWIVFDQACGGRNPGACSYPVSEHGVVGYATSYDEFGGEQICFLAQGAVGTDDKQIVFGTDWDYDTCGGSKGVNTVDRWSANGGTPTNYATLSNGARPYGVAISKLGK